MFNRICFAFLIICISISSAAQKTDRKLEDKLRQLTADFKGDVGIYVKQLKTGKTVAIQADSIFPTASMVKIPILIGIMDKLNKKSCPTTNP